MKVLFNITQMFSFTHRRSYPILSGLHGIYHMYMYTSTKVSKDAKIRNRYNQVPHRTHNTNGKVTNSQPDTTNESQEASPHPPHPPSRRPQGTHKQTRTKAQQTQDRKKHERPTKEAPPRNGQLNIPLEGPNRPNGAPTPPQPKTRIKTQTPGPHGRVKIQSTSGIVPLIGFLRKKKLVWDVLKWSYCAPATRFRFVDKYGHQNPLILLNLLCYHLSFSSMFPYSGLTFYLRFLVACHLLYNLTFVRLNLDLSFLENNVDAAT